MIDKATLEKRRRDLADDAEAGFDTTAKEDALLRQGRPEEDEYTEQAEWMVRDMERQPEFKYSAQFTDPEKRRELVEVLAEGLRGRNGNGRKPAQPKERPRSQLERDNEFWSSDEPKQVMPKKL